MQKPIVSIVAARSGTGKTTFLEKLIKELVKRGYRVGTVKRASQGFEIDKKGKDSWRHAQAGARAVAVVSEDKFAFIQKSDKERGLGQIADFFEEIDIILTEGFKKDNYPKIEVVRREQGSEVSCLGKNLIAVVTDDEKLEVSAKFFALDDAVGVADLLVKKYLQKIDTLGDLNHFDSEGRARMVDVTAKVESERVAIARGEVVMNQQTLELIAQGKMAKGDVLTVARVAGIMGVKKTSDLIPMCHPLNLGAVNIDFEIDKINNKVDIECRVKIVAKTGVEMEALTGVHISALTIYDMCKAVDKDMIINNVRLIKKTGGKSGTYERREG